jgi:Icc-related predicted phosphoesterase
LKFIAISDTHGQHYSLTLPKADAIIHAGDLTMKGDKSEVTDFLFWFHQLHYKYKIFIAGNHDFYFEKNSAEEIKKMIPEGVFYLNDSGIEIEGIHIWGSPVTPWFYNWAFNRHRGDAIKKHWDMVPPGTDLLVTHGPAYNTLDTNTRGESIGCQELLNKILDIKPKVHVCGHIHESFGSMTKYNVKIINASILNESYEFVNHPLHFQL